MLKFRDECAQIFLVHKAAEINYTPDPGK